MPEALEYEDLPYEWPHPLRSANIDDISRFLLRYDFDPEGLTTSISDLPNELLSHIFSFLEAQYIVTRLSRVCKAWRDLVRSDSFWRGLKVLSVEEKRGGTTFAETIISRCPNVRFLRIKKYFGEEHGPSIDPTIPDLCLPRLRTLHIHHINVDWAPNLSAILDECRLLTALHLHGRISPLMLQLIRQRRHMPTLTLDFSTRDEILLVRDILFSLFENMERFSEFSMSICGNVDEFLADSLLRYHAATLTKLTLYIAVNDFCFRNIVNCTKLVELRIHCAGLSDLSLTKIRTLSGLQFLGLANALRFTTTGLREFFTGNAFPELKHVTVSVSGRFVDSTLMALTYNYPSLESLTIGCCANMSTEGITFLMRKCHELRALRLRGVEVNAENLFQPTEEPYLPQLRYLAVLGYNIHICEDRMKDFVEWHPSYRTQTCVVLPQVKDTDEIYLRYLENPHLKPVAMFTNERGNAVTVGHLPNHGLLPE